MIRQEIERRLKEIEQNEIINADARACRNDELKHLLKFLNNLHDPVTDCNDLEEEIKEQIHDRFYDLNGIAVIGTSGYAEVKDMEYIARHFAEWQAKQLLKSSPLPEDTVLFQKGVEEGKRLMMEEAEECELYWDGDFLAIDLNMRELGYSERDKVNIIILPKEV